MVTDGSDLLTDEGRAEVEALARRHDVSPEAVLVLLVALERGSGEQAQFSHPDLGGMGQWSRGGMIMVGDMFNNALKARIDGLCRDTAVLLGQKGMLRAERRPSEAGAWWPAGCGRPSASGAQNDRRYAFFPDTRRLAIGHGDRVELYDTGEHRIHGVSQQQGHGSDLRFTSQLGTVALRELRRVDEAAVPRSAPPEAAPVAPASTRDVPSADTSKHDAPAHDAPGSPARRRAVPTFSIRSSVCMPCSARACSARPSTPKRRKSCWAGFSRRRTPRRPRAARSRTAASVCREG